MLQHGKQIFFVRYNNKHYFKNILIHNLYLYRRQLRLKYPEYIFLPCFAHQCNLAVGEIFKESSTLAIASADAVKLFLYFTHPNNIYFIGKLRNIQMELYNKYYAIIRPGDTRWNSYYDCYKSLIRTKQALRVSKVYFEYNK